MDIPHIDGQDMHEFLWDAPGGPRLVIPAFADPTGLTPVLMVGHISAILLRSETHGVDLAALDPDAVARLRALPRLDVEEIGEAGPARRYQVKVEAVD